MIIKYLDQIHILQNYNSIIRGGQPNNPSIHLQKDNGHFFALEFNSKELRDEILKEIWEKMITKEEFFDIDETIKVFKDAKKYNVI